MLDAGNRISRQIEDARFEDGKHIPIIRVEFYVGIHGPFVERFVKAEYSAAARDEKINAFAREIVS